MFIRSDPFTIDTFNQISPELLSLLAPLWLFDVKAEVGIGIQTPPPPHTHPLPLSVLTQALTKMPLMC